MTFDKGDANLRLNEYEQVTTIFELLLLVSIKPLVCFKEKIVDSL